MNAIPMLQRCGQYQKSEYDPDLPSQVLSPEPAWRAQDSLADPPAATLASEDYEG